jgi:hypothetical protein
MILDLNNKKQIKAFKKKYLAGQKKKGFDPYKYLGKIQNWEGAKTGMEY